MATCLSAKALSNLVCESRTSESVLNQELERNLGDLVSGVLTYGTIEADDASKKQTSEGEASKKKGGKLSAFLKDLAPFLGVPHDKAKPILTSYLAGDFRGTKDSLKKLVNEDRYRKPLMTDIWHFYRSERLYLLKTTKEIMTKTWKEGSKHHATFADIFNQMEELSIGQSLLNQLEYVTSKDSPPPPLTSSGGSVGGGGGSGPNEDLSGFWHHFNLREQSEILQILVLYYANSSEKVGFDDLKRIWKIAHGHRFGKKAVKMTSEQSELTESIGQLESLLMVSVLALAENSTRNHPIWSSKPAVAELDIMITSSLGNLQDHSPIMLSWMLSHFSADGADTLAKFKSLGERSVQLDVLKYLIKVVKNEVVNSNRVVSNVVYGTVYNLITSLLDAFDPECMGLGDDLHQLAVLLLERVDGSFWEAGLESGLGQHFSNCLEDFPAHPKPLVELAVSLAKASTSSADQVLNTLQSLTVFAEPVEDVPSHQVALLSSPSDTEQWQSLATRTPPSAQTLNFRIPAGTLATSSQMSSTSFYGKRGRHSSNVGGPYYRWRIGGGGYDGLKYMFGEVDVALNQVSTGVRNLSKEKLAQVVRIIELMHALLKNSESGLHAIGHFVSKAAYLLIEKFSQVPNPPIDLLTACVRCLSLTSKRKPILVWEKLSETGIFPYFGVPTVASGTARSHDDVNPGLVGALLAQQECVKGSYPLTNAFFDLLLATSATSTGKKGQEGSTNFAVQQHPTTPSLLYLIHDVFPAFQQWGFNAPGERERFGQKMLTICLQILRGGPGGGSSQLKSQVAESLMSPAPNQTLIDIAATGDRSIQSLCLSQTNAESGVGVELSKLVNLALQTLNALLDHHNAGAGGELEARHQASLRAVICSGSGSGGPKSHFLLTIAHYIYHLQSCDVPVAAVNVLTTVANLFPMSMLACFGNDAEAVREIFINRLESKTEDIVLKIAIINFFTSCIESQPGLIQLLLGAKENNNLPRVQNINDKPGSKTNLTAEEEEENEKQLANCCEGGCLNSVVEILADLKEKSSRGLVEGVGVNSGSNSAKARSSLLVDDLHIAVVDFIYNLWLHQRIIAVAYLKKQPDFWSNLTMPLFDKWFASKPKLNGCILRIVSSEIYTYAGKVDKALAGLLNDFFDEKRAYLKDWCELVISELPSLDGDHDVSLITAANTRSPASTSKMDDVIFLLGSWKTFLIVASKDNIPISPAQCHLTVSCLIKAIRTQLTSCERPNSKITTSLSETCLVLMRKWQTKCVSAGKDEMEKFCREQAEMLNELDYAYASLHPRAKAAILSIAGTALKFSAITMDGAQESKVLSTWLPPVVALIQKPENQKETQVPILELGLLRSILTRFDGVSNGGGRWFSVVHERAVVQSVVSMAHHCIRAKERPDLVASALGVLLTLVRSAGSQGSDAVLNNDLVHLLWLPLSELRSSDCLLDWVGVFTLTLQLASALVRQAGQRALDTSISFVALLQDQLTSFLLSPLSSRSSRVSGQHIELTGAAASFISLLFGYYRQWQLQHPTSLANFYHAMARLLNTCVSLLIRPSVLKMLISSKQSGSGSRARPASSTTQGEGSDNQNRSRRISTASIDTLPEAGPGDPASPEVATVQNNLLDITSSCLSVLTALSPKLPELLIGSVADIDAYEILLQIGFSTPQFEQEDYGGLTYGAIISLSNLCIRNLTKGVDHQRSPSPAKSPQPAAASAASTATSSFGLLTTTAGGSNSGVQEANNSASANLSPTSISSMDKRRLVLVLEQSLYVVLAQSLLILNQPDSERITAREKQLLRRELGAELGSVVESIRRYIQRGNRTSTSLLPSPAGTSTTPQKSALSKTDEQFMKLVSTVVQKAFK